MLTEQIKPVANIVICDGVLLCEEPGRYTGCRLLKVRSGQEFTDMLEINVLEPR
jgi:hypothetical protein